MSKIRFAKQTTQTLQPERIASGTKNIMESWLFAKEAETTVLLNNPIPDKNYLIDSRM